MLGLNYNNLFIFSIFILVFLLVPTFLFAQYYPPYSLFFSPYYNYENQQNIDQGQGNNNISVPYFIFPATGTKFAFIYPVLIDATITGMKVNINGSIDYGPFDSVLWYGFSNDGNSYGIVGTTFDGKYSVIVNGVIYNYSISSAATGNISISNNNSNNLNRLREMLMRRIR